MMTVGELAKVSGVSVRTLHHYDELGLVRPSHRGANGYRLYASDDVLRLQQVLVLRELGLSLEDIARTLEDGGDRVALLQQHRAALVARQGALAAMLAAVDHALTTLQKGTQMTSEDFARLFDGFDPAAHVEETQTRWGSTETYAESQRRTRSYDERTWAQIAAEAAALDQRFAALLQEGAAPADPRVQAAVTDHRAHISRWYYACSPALHRRLGEMYVADPRFTKNIDRTAPGLARFLSAAIAAS